MLEKFGIFLISWIIIGLIVATRLVFFNGRFPKKDEKKHVKYFADRGIHLSYNKIKLVGFLGVTLLGYIGFFLDTKNTFFKRKNK